MKGNKSRRTRKRRGQRGGFWPFTSSETVPATSTSTSSSWGDWFSGVSNKAKETTTGLIDGTENALSNATNSISTGFSSALDSTKSILSTDVSFNSGSSGAVSPSYSQSQVAGKRRRRKTTKMHRKSKRKGMRGGKGLGLTYYATPVSGIKMAQPTTWI